MPIFTVHIEQMYDIEADSAQDALTKVAQIETDNTIHGAPDRHNVYVTDEMGEECDMEDHLPLGGACPEPQREACAFCKATVPHLESCNHPKDFERDFLEKELRTLIESMVSEGFEYEEIINIMRDTQSACEHCGGKGVLIGSLYQHDGNVCFDADHIARCDACEMFPGDLEAGEFLARKQEYGAWLVWAEDYGGGLPSTNDSNIFVRTSPGDAACLQLEILKRIQEDPDVPSVFAHVKFVESKGKVEAE